ncbi:MAG: hypothetical protein ABS951_10015 [Solibacillus sp.]
MLKIKKIEFDKTTFDVTMKHHVFSVASVHFTNAEPIHGALLYWQQNSTQDDYTKEDDFKFYYEMGQQQFYASVQFPISAQLSQEQRKELAFILLEERGHIGSYSVESSKAILDKLNSKKQLAYFVFPKQFSATDFSPFLTAEQDQELKALTDKYEPQFIQLYLQWRKQAAVLHPNDITPYIPMIGLPYLCYVNPHLSELFLIEHLQEIDFGALQHNSAILKHLSPSFKQHMLDTLQKNNEPLLDELQLDPEGFVDTTFDIDVVDETETELELEQQPPYTHFEYERSLFEWSGAEHMVKGIPSFASQMYDAQQFKKRTNQQMDTLMYSFSPQQIRLFSAIAELHWLHRYREFINWDAASRYNAHLTDDFLTELASFIIIEQLAQNKYCEVSEAYLIESMAKFKAYHPAPLILSHLTAHLFNLFHEELQLNLDLLYDYYEYIDQHDFAIIFDLLSPEQAQ